MNPTCGDLYFSVEYLGTKNSVCVKWHHKKLNLQRAYLEVHENNQKAIDRRSSGFYKCYWPVLQGNLI